MVGRSLSHPDREGHTILNAPPTPSCAPPPLMCSLLRLVHSCAPSCDLPLPVPRHPLPPAPPSCAPPCAPVMPPSRPLPPLPPPLLLHPPSPPSCAPSLLSG